MNIFHLPQFFFSVRITLCFRRDTVQVTISDDSIPVLCLCEYSETGHKCSDRDRSSFLEAKLVAGSSLRPPLKPEAHKLSHDDMRERQRGGG